MSVIRVVDCAYKPFEDTFLLSIDVLHPRDPESDRNYLVVAPRQRVDSEDKLRKYVEDSIVSQRTALPDWTGTSWKSTIDEQDPH